MSKRHHQDIQSQEDKDFNNAEIIDREILKYKKAISKPNPSKTQNIIQDTEEHHPFVYENKNHLAPGKKTVIAIRVRKKNQTGVV